MLNFRSLNLWNRAVRTKLSVRGTLSRCCGSLSEKDNIVAKSCETIVKCCHPADVEVFRKTLATVSAQPSMQHVITTSLSFRATHEMKSALQWLSKTMASAGEITPLEISVDTKFPSIERKFMKAYKNFDYMRQGKPSTQTRISANVRNQLQAIILSIPPQLVVELTSFLTKTVDKKCNSVTMDHLVDDLLDSFGYYRHAALRLFTVMDMSDVVRQRLTKRGYKKKGDVISMLKKQLDIALNSRLTDVGASESTSDRAKFHGVRHRTCVPIQARHVFQVQSAYPEMGEDNLHLGFGVDSNSGDAKEAEDIDILEKERSSKEPIFGVLKEFDEPKECKGEVTLSVPARPELSAVDLLSSVDKFRRTDDGYRNADENFGADFVPPDTDISLLQLSSSPQHKVLLRNIPPGLKPSELREAMSRIGEVTAVKIFTADKFEAGIAPPPADMTRLNKGVKKFSHVKKRVVSDSYAFVVFKDAEGYQKVLRDDVQIFGLCLKGYQCKVEKAHPLKTLTLELTDDFKTPKWLHIIGNYLGSDYNLTYDEGYDDHKPSFLALTFPSHEQAWDAYVLLSIASQQSPELNFFPSWIQSSWYFALMSQAREARRNSSIYLQRVSNAVENVQKNVDKNANKLQKVSLAYKRVDKDGIPIATQF